MRNGPPPTDPKYIDGAAVALTTAMPAVKPRAVATADDDGPCGTVRHPKSRNVLNRTPTRSRKNVFPVAGMVPRSWPNSIVDVPVPLRQQAVQTLASAPVTSPVKRTRMPMMCDESAADPVVGSAGKLPAATVSCFTVAPAAAVQDPLPFGPA